ncbi:hypothetical protein LINPERHAP1_LOCUS25238 [Linum perenne]
MDLIRSNISCGSLLTSACSPMKKGEDATLRTRLTVPVVFASLNPLNM